MSVVKMKKLTVFAHRRDSDALIRRLLRLRCVEVRPYEADAGDDGPSFERGGDSVRRAELEKLFSDTERTLSSLARYRSGKKGFVKKAIHVRLDKFYSDGSYAKATGLIKQTDEVLARVTELRSEEAKLGAVMQALIPWRGYDLPFDFGGTESTVLFTGTMPASVTDKQIERAVGDLPLCSVRVGEDKKTACYSFICLRGDADEAALKLSSIGMMKTQFGGMNGTADREIARLEKKLKDLASQKDSCDKELRKIAENIELIEILYDALGTSISAEKTKENLLMTETCVILHGWIPEPQTERVKSALSRFECAYEIEEAGEADEPPVLLENNFIAESFEWVLGMYSYPKYGRFDPTFIMSIFYFIIFGLMFADVGYGAILIVACFGAIWFLNPKKGMRNFLAMFGYCGISSVIMGILFGSYFGNMPQAYSEYMLGVEGATSTMQTAVLFDPLADPMSFLIISIAVGAVHLVAGMAVKFYILCRDGKVLDAFCDIGSWWLVFAGIGLAFVFPWGKYVAILGALAVVLASGRHENKILLKIGKGLLGLYGAVNYVSDLLSYSRILALGLAAAVIAQVINTMGTMGGPSVFGFIMMVVVFIIGHLLNLVINVLGTFVHTSRLQYIEFFGKFYEDGGRQFKPAAPSDKYTTEQ